jgi:MFS family permease
VSGIRKRTGHIFFGWWIVLSSSIIQGLGAALHQQSFGAYFVKLKEEFGWSSTALSGAFSVASLVGGALGPLQGWLIDRIGTRNVMRIGLVLFAGSLMMFSQVNSLWSFYLATTLMLTGSNLTSLLTATVAVARWFIRRRTTAISLSLAGSSVGGLAVPLVALSLDAFGWRGTAFGSGIIVLILGLPLAQFFRDAPEPFGLLPDGDKPPEGSSYKSIRQSRMQKTGQAGPVQLEGFTVSEMLRTRAFWLIGIAQMSAVLGISVIMIHLIPYLEQELDYSLVLAGVIVSISLASMMAAQVLGGFISDRYNKRVITTITMVGSGASMIILGLANSMWLVVLFALLHGVSSGFRLPLILSLRAEFFGRRSLGSVMALGAMFGTVAQVIGPIFAGLMVDHLGSYREAFIIVAFIIIGLGAISFAAATKPTMPPREAEPTTEPKPAI